MRKPGQAVFPFHISRKGGLCNVLKVKHQDFMTFILVIFFFSFLVLYHDASHYIMLTVEITLFSFLYRTLLMRLVEMTPLSID